MDTTLAFVIIVIAILAAVVFLRWQDQQNKFEDDESRKELLDLFRQGFQEGINSNGGVLDSTLKRIGYTYPEQMQNVPTDPAIVPADKSEGPEYVPLHELDFDLEEAANRNEAQWVTQVQLPQDES